MKALTIINLLKDHKVTPRLEKGVLKLTGNVGALDAALLADVKAQKQDIIDFLADVFSSQAAYEPIPVVELQPHYPLSNAQQRMWILSQFEGGSTAYNIVKGFYLDGALNAAYLEQAFNLLIQRHEILRTVFREVDGVPAQYILDSIPFDITVKDICNEADKKNYLRQALSGINNWVFNMQTGPLLKIELLQFSDTEYAMIFGMHHIISDGWSMGVMVQEVMRYYKTLCLQQPLEQAPLTIQYKDYAAWLRNKLEDDAGSRHKAYWLDYLSGDMAPLQLPTDHARPAIQRYKGATVKHYFETAQYEQIQDFCRKTQVTLFSFLQATVNILLHKLTGQPQLFTGTPVSGRNHFDLENQIGLYVNTIVLKTIIDAGDTFLSYLKATHQQLLLSFEHQEYPFDKLVEDLQIKRDTSRHPLFDVMVVLQNTAFGDGSIPIDQQYGFSLNDLDKYLYQGERLSKQDYAAKFDLSFSFANEPGNKFYLEVDYSTGLFNETTIDNFVKYYHHIIRQVLETPVITNAEIVLLDKAGIANALNVFNAPAGVITEQHIMELLQPALKEHAGKTAVLAGDRQLTFAELDKRSDELARRLGEKIPYGRQAFVGLMMERTADVPVSILGILKAGLAYVPVDTGYPASRIAFILEDAQPALILADAAGAALVPPAFSTRVLQVQDAAPAAAPLSAYIRDSERTAYMIYTSGSTGKPKGVEICHRNTIAFLKWAQREFRDSNFDMLYAATSYCFDLSVFEMLFPLLTGKTIRLLESALEIPFYLTEDKKVMLNTVPSVVRNLLDNQTDLSSVTALNMAGEAVPARFRQLLPYGRMEVRNLYGPTEDTTYSTVYKFEEDGCDIVPIGTPVDHSRLYILDGSMNLLPPGIEGEICLSGHGVAKGYYNRPELTEQRFIPDPFITGQMMYRTGDTGKWLPDGKVVYTGRRDDQVKIRGYRIEPGEITALLEQLPGVSQALVTALELNGESSLVAYWQGEDDHIQDTLKTAVTAQLPAYMHPAYWIRLEAFPLNSNGKVDKAQLPKPSAGSTAVTAIVPPATALQQVLLATWENVLGRNDFGVEHNFFELGGHSLKATRLKALIHKELQKEISMDEIFRAPTITAQAGILEKKDAQQHNNIEKAAPQTYYPVSFSQERLWVLTEFEDASVAYHMPAAFMVHGELDTGRLESALQAVISRHEILRTVFLEKDGLPMQQILPREAVTCRVEKQVLNEPASPEALTTFIRTLWEKPFDLRNGPLLHTVLIQLQEGGQVLCFNMHHIISDGWSVGILIKELMQAYKGIPVTGSLAFQYKDFAVWQRKWLSGERLAQYRDYWLSVLHNEITPLALPVDFPRPEVKTYKGGICRHTIPADLTAALRHLSQQSGASIFSMLVTTVHILLNKYTGQDDIVTGCPVAGREHWQLDNQIGMYVNTLPLRSFIDAGQTFTALLENEQSILLKAFEHQAYPFEQLIEDLQLKRDLSRSPVFDVTIVLLHDSVLDIDNIDHLSQDFRLERLPVDSGTTKYDLNFSFVDGADALKLEIEYNSDLYKEDTVLHMIRYLENIMQQVVTIPGITVKDIRLLPEAEQQQLQVKADNTAVTYNMEATISSLFQQAVTTYPDNIALKTGQREITYRELDTLSGQLAQVLLDQYNIQPEELVVLHFDRNEWMLVAIIAVLKAGAAYVPADPSYPDARIDYIITDSGSRIVLTDAMLHTALQERHTGILFFDITTATYEGPLAQQDIKPEQLAYVIYTSGTTGQPKGVMIEHRNVTRLLFNDECLFDFNSLDRWSLFHSYCFDFSVWEMYGALLYGGTLVIVPKETAQNSVDFFDFLATEGITVLNQTPTAFRSLLQQNSHRFDTTNLQVRYLIFGGEALMPEVLQDWYTAFPLCRIINMYGITETTVHVTYKEITQRDITGNKSNIGLPIPTLSCYVLDKHLQQAPAGVAGELCIGGAGVARGYLNKPALTAARFAADPFIQGGRLYRSGDYARIMPSGDIEYIGRMDDQVKIRGHRIELGEIEAALLKLPQIKDAVVLALKNDKNETELAAYYITEQPPADNNLRSSLAAVLPHYMVPSYLITVAAFPLTSNGKLDKKALPAPENINWQQTAFVPPRNKTDERIVQIWQEILQRPQIGIQDNFFELGGHSLKATRVISQIHEQLGVKIDLKNLFIQPTIQHLSDYIDAVSWMNESRNTVEDSSNVGELIL